MIRSLCKSTLLLLGISGLISAHSLGIYPLSYLRLLLYGLTIGLSVVLIWIYEVLK